MDKSLIACLISLCLVPVCSAEGQIPVTGPGNELLIFENVSFGPDSARGAGMTRIFGTVTNAAEDYLANAVIKVRFFDRTSRIFPRPSIACKFSIEDLVPGRSKEIGEKNLKEAPEQQGNSGGPVLKRKPADCNAFISSLEIGTFSLEVVSALHGRHVLTTVKPLSRLYRENGNPVPWDLLREETQVEVLAFVPGREGSFKVNILEEGCIGYVEYDRLVATPEVVALRQTATDSAKTVSHIRQGEEEVRPQERFGRDVAAAIFARKFRTGMTREMALESLGKPREMNRTLLIESVHEEWIYGSGLQLHFDNGILTGYQESRK